MRAAGLVCLGAGAGLIRGDLRDVRGKDVAARSGGVVVAVRGARPRTVPVPVRYHRPLLAAARFAGAGLIFGIQSGPRLADHGYQNRWWGGWGSNPRPADYENYGPVHRAR